MQSLGHCCGHCRNQASESKPAPNLYHPRIECRNPRVGTCTNQTSPATNSCNEAVKALGGPLWHFASLFRSLRPDYAWFTKGTCYNWKWNRLVICRQAAAPATPSIISSNSSECCTSLVPATAGSCMHLSVLNSGIDNLKATCTKQQTQQTFCTSQQPASSHQERLVHERVFPLVRVVHLMCYPAGSDPHIESRISSTMWCYDLLSNTLNTPACLNRICNHPKAKLLNLNP